MMQNVAMAAVVGNIQKVEEGVQKFKGAQNNFPENYLKALKILSYHNLQKNLVSV